MLKNEIMAMTEARAQGLLIEHKAPPPIGHCTAILKARSKGYENTIICFFEDQESKIKFKLLARFYNGGFHCQPGRGLDFSKPGLEGKEFSVGVKTESVEIIVWDCAGGW